MILNDEYMHDELIKNYFLHPFHLQIVDGQSLETLDGVKGDVHRLSPNYLLSPRTAAAITSTAVSPSSAVVRVPQSPQSPLLLSRRHCLDSRPPLTLRRGGRLLSVSVLSSAA